MSYSRFLEYLDMGRVKKVGLSCTWWYGRLLTQSGDSVPPAYLLAHVAG